MTCRLEMDGVFGQLYHSCDNDVSKSGAICRAGVFRRFPSCSPARGMRARSAEKVQKRDRRISALLINVVGGISGKIMHGLCRQILLGALDRDLATKAMHDLPGYP